MAFQTMPYLFAKWGPVLSALLFIAGITSSLAMGTPLKSFMEDEFDWDLKKSAWFFGILVFIFGLVIFALTEIILFSWVFGVDKGWEEITKGADINVPYIYKYVIKYITPIFLLGVFIGALITPENNDWLNAFHKLGTGEGWPLGANSLIGKIFHLEVKRFEYFTDKGATKTFYQDLARLLLVILFGITGFRNRDFLLFFA